jgi:hypothetical protein
MRYRVNNVPSTLWMKENDVQQSTIPKDDEIDGVASATVRDVWVLHR